MGFRKAFLLYQAKSRFNLELDSEVSPSKGIGKKEKDMRVYRR
jgi:hypothetical protein